MTSAAMSFDRPVGIHRDIAELEFITALLQTPKTFLRNRVTAQDIVVYLRSRHGVNITIDSVRQLLVRDLAGSTCDNQDHDAIDPCQLVTIFLLPQLLLALEGGDDEKNSVFEPLSKEIAAFKKNKELTVEELSKVVSQVGENNFSDSLLHEMVALLKANDGNIAKTLTSDLAAFDIGWENKSTTNFVDAMHATAHEKALTEQSQPIDNGFSVVSTASFIDYTADTFRRPAFHALLLGCGIATYFAYVLNVEADWLDLECDAEHPGCQIAKGLVRWLYLFVQLVVLGVPFVVLGSFGNSIRSSTPPVHVLRLLVAIAAIGMYTIYPYFKTMSTPFFNTGGNKDFDSFESYCYYYQEDDAGDDDAGNDDVWNDDTGDDDTIAIEDCVAQCITDPSICPLKYIPKNDEYGAAYWLSLGLGCLLIAMLLVDLIYFFLPKGWLSRTGGFSTVVTPGAVRQETAAKKAASFRMSQMLENALNLQPGQENNIKEHGVRRSLKRMSPNCSVMERFQMHPKVTEAVGGVSWVWKRVFDGTLFSEEGVWIGGRILACNFAQLMVIGMVIFFTTYWINQQGDWLYSKDEISTSEYVSRVKLDLEQNPSYRTEKFMHELTDFGDCVGFLLEVNLTSIWTDWREESTGSRVVELLNKVGVGVKDVLSYSGLRECLNATDDIVVFMEYLRDVETVANHKTDIIKDLALDIDFSNTEFKVGAWMAFITGCIVSLSTAMVLIPSYVSSVLKFRSGYLPSLGDREFLRFRFAPDVVTVLLGSAFWGTFFTSIAAMVLSAAFAAFFTTVGPALLGTIVGFLVVLVIRIVILKFLRGPYFSAFLRQRPGAANFAMVVLEVWNIGLTVGFVTARVIKLMAISIFFIARIDTPVLAPGVGRLGPVELDSVAISFRKELLAHESHRHVLIERFGLLCLLKLRMKDSFATRAGSTWRLLYVLTVMPWLRRYRVTDIGLENADESLQHHEHELKHEKDQTARREIKEQMDIVVEDTLLSNAESSEAELKNQIKRLRSRNKHLEKKILSVLESQNTEKYHAC